MALEKKQSWLSNPEFRKHAIVVLILTFFVQYFASALAGDSYNVLVVYLPQLYGWTESQLANAYTISGIVSIFTGIVFGSMISKWGPKKCGVLFCIVMGVSQIAMAVGSSHLWVYSVTWIVIKCLQTAMQYVLASFTANWFVSYRGRALGINTIGAPLNTATTSAILTAGCASIGFSAVYSIYGVAVIVLGLLILFFTRSTPQEYGLYPDGITRTQEEIDSLNEEMERTSRGEWSLKKILTTKDSLLMTIAMIILNFTFGAMIIYFLPRFLAGGVSVASCVTALSVGGLCAIPISYLYGWIDDKFGTQKATLIFAIVLLISLVGMIFGDQGVPFLVLAALGIASASGGLPNLSPSLAVHVFGREHFMACHKWTYAFAVGATAFNAMYMASFSAASVACGGTEVAGYVLGYKILCIPMVIAIVCLALIGKSYDSKKAEQ